MNNLSYVGKTVPAEEQTPHSHGDFEIIRFESDGAFEANGVRFDCHDGDVAVIPPLVAHRVECPNAIRAVLDKGLLPVKSACVIPADEAEEIRTAVSQSAVHANEIGRHREAILSAYGSLIAALITANVVRDGHSPAVQSVLDDCEKHVSDPSYSLEAFLRSLPLNYDYVRKLFKKEVGATPHDYFTRMRMECARNIILSGVTNRYSDYTVTQIAEACGFSEPLYFSRVFKKHFGVSPANYMRGIR